MVENNFTYMFTNPEMDEPKDPLGHELIFMAVNGGLHYVMAKIIVKSLVS